MLLCLLHVVIIPSTFRNYIKARTCSRIPTGIPLDKLQTTWTPCISYTCAKERLMIDRLCFPTGVGNDKFDGRV
jgi:hypothetical protein